MPGAKVTIMRRLGHFPMSENPDLFLSYLEPVLAEIAGKGLSHCERGASNLARGALRSGCRGAIGSAQ